MTEKTIVINTKFETQNGGAKQAANNLKAIEEQANRTREKMEKLAQVGTKLALVGAGIVGPLGLAMKKYLDTVKDAEPVSKRITELSKKWEESQVRLGRIVATYVLPALEKGAVMLEKVIAFAEANPGVVKAALTIGTTLVILGGIIATTAQLVSTVATIQGLAASAGLSIGGGGVAAGAGAVGGGGLVAAITAGISAAIPALVYGIALVIGGQIGLGLGNALAGTNQTWADILETLRLLGILFKQAFSNLFTAIGQGLQSIGRTFGEALKSIGNFIYSLFRGGKASGGYMSFPGLYAGAEAGREYVLNASTTRAAEQIIGGQLNQGRALSYVTNNLNIGGATVAQSKRQVIANKRAVMEGIIEL